MTTCNHLFAVLLFAGSLTAPATHADQAYRDTGISTSQPNELQNQSYVQKTTDKALNGLSNLGAGVWEVPKNVINTTNDSNIFYGITGGLFKGLLNTVGRVSVGVTDLLSLAIPTKPIAYPVHVWEHTKIDTTYGNVFELDLPQATQQTIAEPVAPVPATNPVVVAPRLPVMDSSGQQTNKKLDTLFKKQMMK